MTTFLSSICVRKIGVVRLIIATALSCLLLPAQVLAVEAPSGAAQSVQSTQTNSSCSGVECTDPAASNDKCSNDRCDFIKKYINPFVDLLTAVFGVLAVISLILGGIQYSTSSGDPQQVGKAKKRIVNTLIALIAFFFLYGFLQFLIPGGLFNHRGV